MGNLIFIGSTPDKKFLALDALSDKQFCSYQLDGLGCSTPMRFSVSDRKQYVVIAYGAPGVEFWSRLCTITLSTVPTKVLLSL